MLVGLQILSRCAGLHREPEGVGEQPAGLPRPAASRNQPGGDGGPVCPQATGHPQGHR